MRTTKQTFPGVELGARRSGHRTLSRPAQAALAACVGLVLSWAHRAVAEPSPPPPNPERKTLSAPPPRDGRQPPGDWHGHRLGNKLYLRLYEGSAYFVASESYLIPTCEGCSPHKMEGSYRGWGTSFGASLGGVIARNLSLYGEFVGTMASDLHGSPDSSPQEPANVHVYQFGSGPGVSYHFEPLNLHFSGTLTFTKAWLGDLGHTNLGVGFNSTLGEEWRVSADFGICLALQAHVATMGNSYYGYNGTHLKTGTFALVLSATYN